MTDSVGNPAGSRAVVIARILDRDREMLSLATRLEEAVPAAQPDLTMRQLYALVLLSARPRHVGEVASALGITISSASGLIDRLVRARLVTRQSGETDRRTVVCQLTDTGHAVLRQFLDIGRLRLERLLTQLQIEDLLIVERALDRLIAAASDVVGDSRPRTSAAS